MTSQISAHSRTVDRKNSTEQLWRHFKHRISQTKPEVSIQSRNTAALAHIQLARKEAHSFVDRCRESYEDLEQLAFSGLLLAVERFDPTMGVSFSSFAVPYIRGAILHHLRDHGSSVKVPRRMRETHSRAGKIERVWVVTRGKAPTEEELAAEMGVTVQKLRQVRGAIANQMALPFEDDFCEIAAPEQYSIDTEHLGRLESAWKRLRGNLNQLHTSELDLIRCVYFQRLSIKATARRFNMTPEALEAKLNRVLTRLAN